MHFACFMCLIIKSNWSSAALHVSKEQMLHESCSDQICSAYRICQWKVCYYTHQWLTRLPPVKTLIDIKRLVPNADACADQFGFCNGCWLCVAARPVIIILVQQPCKTACHISLAQQLASAVCIAGRHGCWPSTCCWSSICCWLWFWCHNPSIPWLGCLRQPKTVWLQWRWAT